MAENKDESVSSADFDVVIIGAGISGINTAQRIQTQLPWASYTILEARQDMGGTWDFFRYPGIRSDSDLYTFGFSWYPWTSPNAIAHGESIKKYMKEAAAKYGINEKIRYRNKVLSANWSSQENCWSFNVQQPSSSFSSSKQTDDGVQEKVLKGRLLVFGTGYYNYNEPLKSPIAGLDKFQGLVVHPQFWPKDLDYTGKKIAIVGSGATAITLLPVLAETASRVTMIQRSPAYIMSVTSDDLLNRMFRVLLPGWIAHRLARWRFLIISFLFFNFCRAFPQAARSLIRTLTVKQLPPSIPLDPHFNPSYNPWEQRLCACPDGDFFKALSAGKADVVTGSIQTVKEAGVVMNDGTEIEVDILITATGLKLQLFGGMSLTIDGEPFGDLSDKLMWRGMMLQDLPNACMVFGYTNASWTLGAETSAQFICRLLAYMKTHSMVSAVPRLQEKDKYMHRVSMLNLNSTYIQRAKHDLPCSGDKSPWLPRSNYFNDLLTANWSDITASMEFSKI